MSRTTKRKRIAAGNTFKRDEVDGLLQLLDMLHRGQDVRVIMRSEVIQRIYKKFVRMRVTLERSHQEAMLRRAEENR